MSRFNLGLVVTANIVQARSSMRALGAEAERMAGRQSVLAQSIKKYQRDVSKGASAAVRAASALYSGAHFVAKFTNRAREADYELRGLAATVGITASQAEVMYRQLRRTNPELRNFTPTQVIARMKEMAQAGYAQTEVLDRTAAVLRAVNASMGALDIERATELGINLEKGFGTANRTMSELFDVAIEGAAKFPMTVDKIATGLSYATETAVAYNQSLESVIISLGTLMPITKTASKAGTAYRALLQSIVRPQTVEAIEKWGIQVRDVNGEFRDANSLLADIATKMQDVKAEDKKKGTFKYEQQIRAFFGTRGQAAFAAYERLPYDVHARKGEFGNTTQFADANAALAYQQTMLSNVEGATDRFAKAMEESSQLIHEAFVSSVDEVTIQVGKAMLPMVDFLKKAATGGLGDISNALEDSPAFGALVKGLMLVAGGGMLATLPGLIRAGKGLWTGAQAIPALTRQAEIASGQGFIPPGGPKYRHRRFGGMGGAIDSAKLFFRLGEAGSTHLTRDAATGGIKYEKGYIKRLLQGGPALTGYDRAINMREHDRAAGYRLPRDMIRDTPATTFGQKMGQLATGLSGLALVATEVVASWQVMMQGLKETSRELNAAWQNQIDTFSKDQEKFGALGDMLDKYLSGKTWTEEDQKVLYAKGLVGPWNMLMQSLLSSEYGGRGEGLEKGMARVSAARREQFERDWGYKPDRALKDENATPEVKAAAAKYLEAEQRNKDMIRELVMKHINSQLVRGGGITKEQIMNEVMLNLPDNDMFISMFKPAYAGDPNGELNAARDLATKRMEALGSGGMLDRAASYAALQTLSLQNDNPILADFLERNGGMGKVADDPALLRKLHDIGRSGPSMWGLGNLDGVHYDAGNKADLQFVAETIGKEVGKAFEAAYAKGTPPGTSPLEVVVVSGRGGRAFSEAAPVADIPNYSAGW